MLFLRSYTDPGFHRLYIAWQASPSINPSKHLVTMINPDDWALWFRVWGQQGLLVWWDRTGRGLGN